MEQARRVDSYVQNNLVRNFTVNVLDGTFFMLGMSFSSVVTVMPLFVSQLSSSPLLISLIPAIQNVGWFLPALFTAHYVEKLPRKKPFAQGHCRRGRVIFQCHIGFVDDLGEFLLLCDLGDTLKNLDRGSFVLCLLADFRLQPIGFA